MKVRTVATIVFTIDYLMSRTLLSLNIVYNFDTKMTMMFYRLKIEDFVRTMQI